jgi:hypothetical protein
MEHYLQLHTHASLNGMPLKMKVTVTELVRFEVFTAVTMKNGVFWDIKPQFVLHRRHVTSPLHCPAS